MESNLIQYILIGILFIIALAYVGKRLIPTKKNNGGCGKNCGCEAMSKPTK